MHKTIGDTAVVYTEGYNQTETKYSVIAPFPFDDAILSGIPADRIRRYGFAFWGKEVLIG